MRPKRVGVRAARTLVGVRTVLDVAQAYGLVVGTVAALASGCGFHAAVDAKAHVTCTSTADCPPAWICDVDARRCAPPGGGADVSPPRLTALALTPPAARFGGVVELVLGASEPLSARPTLGWDVDPGLAPVDAAPGGDSFTWRMVVGDGVDGAFHLASVHLVDDAGNIADVAVNATLTIDRAAPAVTDVVATPAHASSVAPFNTVTVAFRTDDTAPANVAGLLATRAFPCVSAGANGTGSAYTCTAVVGDDIPDGPASVVALVTDAAGNLTAVGTTIDVDHTPPQVLAGTPSVRMSGGGAAQSVTTLVGGGAIDVAFDVDEAMVGAQAHVDGPGGASLALATTIVGSHVTASAAVPFGLALGAYALVLDAVDTVGNAGTVVVSVPAPGIVVSEGVPSPCVATLADGTPVCTDFDGDGFDGRSPACLNGADCDDDDPLTYPGAPADIPGDHTSNRCDGQIGRLVDEGEGVFVSPAGNDGADGSRATPMLHLDAALARALGSGRTSLFLQAGTYANAARIGDDTGVDGFAVVGGFDASWERAVGARSVVVFADPGGTPDARISFRGRIILEGLEIHFVNSYYSASSNGNDIVMRDVTMLDECAQSDGCYFFDVHEARASHSRFVAMPFSSMADVKLFDSVVEEARGGATDSVSLVRTRVEGGSFGCQPGDMTITSSVVGAGLFAAGTLRAFGSTLAGSYLLGDTPRVIAVNSIIDAEDTRLFDTVPTSLALTGSDLVARCITDTECDVPAFAACGWPGCGSVVASVYQVDPRYVFGTLTLAADSPLLGAGVPALAAGGTTTMVGDVDGACRSTTQPAVGGDER